VLRAAAQDGGLKSLLGELAAKARPTVSSKWSRRVRLLTGFSFSVFIAFGGPAGPWELPHGRGLATLFPFRTASASDPCFFF
jgi:hypothetical protein